MYTRDEAVFEYMTNDAQSPTNGLNVDGSVTPVLFEANPAAGQYWIITRMLIYMEDTTAFSSTEFGGLAAALTNGLSIQVDSGELMNWKDNVDIQTCMFDADGKAVYALATKSLSGRWTFTKSDPDDLGPAFQDRKGLLVRESVGALVQDNLALLDVFRIRVHGKKYND